MSTSLLKKIASKSVTIVGIGCTLHCFFEYVCDFVVCSGESMQPTLKNNNILLCSKMAQRFDKIYRNDIIIAIHPTAPTTLICKRIVGMEGDTIIMNKISDDVTDEARAYSDTKRIVIKRGSAWIEGDNRVNSTDSRNYGPVPVGLIKSKVVARLWPLNEFRVF